MRKSFLALAFLALCTVLAAQQALNNDSVIKLVKAGLSDDLIVTMVNAQPGTYDTSASGLSALRSAGASEKIIAAIVARTTPAQSPCPATDPRSSSPDHSCSDAAVANAAKRYTVEFVHSNRKWRHLLDPSGISTDRYDDISNDIQTELIDAMDHKDFVRSNSPDGDCCKLTIELLSVEIKRAGIHAYVELTTNFTFTDGKGRICYSKKYTAKEYPELRQGTSYEDAKRRAIPELVENITSDDAFIRSLNAGISAQ